MPKIKSNSGASKRFRPTGSGRFKRGSAFRRHILTKKTTKGKRQLRAPTLVHPSDQKSIARQLPYV